MGQKIAIVLFNLGGPDDQAAVQPFLQNLFSDPAIIRVPGPIRWALARLISFTRAKSARANYAKWVADRRWCPKQMPKRALSRKP